VRTMSDVAVPGRSQRSCLTPAGFGFVALLNGVYTTGDGNSFQNLSAQIKPDLWRESSHNGAIGPGQATFGANFLLAPHGLMYDFRTKSWFRYDAFDGSTTGSFHSWFDAFLHKFFVGSGGTDFTLYEIDVYEDFREEDYTWKSAPMRLPERDLRVREVQVVLKAENNASSVYCAVGSHGRTINVSGSLRQTISFLFDEFDEMLDVEIQAHSNEAGVEAPMIEAVRVGIHNRYQTR